MESQKTSLLAHASWIVLLIAGLAELYFGLSDLNKTFSDTPEVFEQTANALHAATLYEYSFPLAVGRILLGISMVIAVVFRSKLNKKLILALGILLVINTVPVFFLLDNTEKAFYYLGFTRAVSVICYGILLYYFRKGMFAS